MHFAVCETYFELHLIVLYHGSSLKPSIFSFCADLLRERFVLIKSENLGRRKKSGLPQLGPLFHLLSQRHDWPSNWSTLVWWTQVIPEENLTIQQSTRTHFLQERAASDMEPRCSSNMLLKPTLGNYGSHSCVIPLLLPSRVCDLSGSS